MNIVPCAIQWDLIVYLFYIQWFVSADLRLLIYTSLPLAPLATISLSSVSVSLLHK